MESRKELKTLSLEELSSVVGAYPWFAGARKELYSRLAALGELDERQCAEATLHIGDRKVLTSLLKDVRLDSGQDARQDTVIVAGGDFFSRSDYDRLKGEGDFVFRSKEENVPGHPRDGAGDLGFYTETLAQIYIEQGFFDQAITIYSKLILEYPEKSAYFATLIDRLKEKINR